MSVGDSILFFSHEFPPIGGGAGSVAKNNVNELLELGYRVTLVTQKNSALDELVNSNLEIIEVTYVPLIYQFFYLLKFKKVNIVKYKYIILNDMTAVYLAGFIFSTPSLCKSIAFLHGSEPEYIYQSPSPYFRLVFYRFFFRRVLTKCNKIIAVSSYMKSKFIKADPKIAALKKIQVKYSKIDDAFRMCLRPTTTSFKSTGKKKIALISVSRIEKLKGFEVMYEIFKKLITYSSSFQWTIIGDGPYKTTIEKMVIADGLGGHVHLTGKLKPSEIATYYHKSDLFWLLSEMRESFGLVYLEAQACGCPAMGYNRYGVKEAICSKNGFLINSPAEAYDLIISERYLTFNKKRVSEFASSFNAGIRSVL